MCANYDKLQEIKDKRPDLTKDEIFESFVMIKLAELEYKSKSPFGF